MALMSEPTAAAKKLGEVFGKPAFTYIEECNFERNLGKSIDTESTARPLTWGKLCEKRVFGLLGMEYSLTSTEPIQHPHISCWSGTPDGEKLDEGKTVMDIKCPMTLKSFCQLVAPILKGLSGMDAMNMVRDKHKDGDKYFWQLVSNSILTKSKYAELIVYAPYQGELQEIRDMVANLEVDKLYQYFWITNAMDDELPSLIEGGKYKNINTIRFEVPLEDKMNLIDRVKKASTLLIER